MGYKKQDFSSYLVEMTIPQLIEKLRSYYDES